MTTDLSPVDRATDERRDAPPVAARPLRRRKGITSWVRHGGLSTFLFLLPLLLTFGYMSWWPTIKAIPMSFQRTNLVEPPTWVGWSNFERVFSDPNLAAAIGNTLQYVGVSVLVGLPIPIVLAVFIGELRRARGFASALAYLPVIMPPVVSVLLWKVFYDPSENGLFNTALSWIGAGPFAWLNDSDMVIGAIIAQVTWANFGTATVIYLATLMSINTELYEAAEMDGANIRRRLWHVTLPQMRPILLIMLLLQLIGVFQLFTEPYIMTGGGPANRSLSILMLIYRYAIVQGDYGKATALSLLLAVALSLLSALYLSATKRWSTT